jgi:hypothetical protein
VHFVGGFPFSAVKSSIFPRARRPSTRGSPRDINSAGNRNAAAAIAAHSAIKRYHRVLAIRTFEDS